MTAVAVLQPAVELEGRLVRVQQRRVVLSLVAVLRSYWRQVGRLKSLVEGACRGMGWEELRARLGA